MNVEMDFDHSHDDHHKSNQVINLHSSRILNVASSLFLFFET